ncbi:alginate lyase family protein [Bacteroides sp. 1001136B_160425_E2]|uniref:alginate lyase family protein n=1 Tax=Bacteroides sp. 1001136B_160425_E2 TaxID=2787083 RepID=UPI00189DE8A8|nr:alginate lyase family protein [Bacteroides sp. 1001136B_160425_E2]
MKNFIRTKRICILFVYLLILMPAHAQSIWDKTNLEKVKQQIDQPAYQTAYNALLERAEQALKQPNLSVMMKEKTAISGNKHDYYSQARYFWPDPTKPDGKPYINRDGISNPELNKLDRNRLGNMANNVTALSLAWYFSNDERYAQKAVEQLQVWFLNKETLMNPHLKYAQVAPGHGNDEGRSFGIIDTYSFVEMLEGVQLLEKSAAFSKKDQKALKAWFSKLLEWIQNSKQGKEESKQKNNHSTAYDAQAIAFALYTGNTRLAKSILEQVPEKRIYKQIAPDGKQKEELWRTLAFGYSEYNLQHLIDIATISQKLNIPIHQASSEDGRNIYKAADYLKNFLGKDVSAWPYKQISDWQGKQQELCKDLYRLYLLDPTRTEYKKAFFRYWNQNKKDRFSLLFLHPDDANQLPNETDRMFTFAAHQLKFAIQCTADTRKNTKDKKRISPRSIEKDGSLRIVRPWDWCSGFFPGSLWQLYAYTKDNYWKEQAATHTWPLEEIKNHRGTHDLGFMVYCSFGQGYELTGDTTFRNVIIQAAQTLSTRYNPTVKAIRSWDFNREKWQYPVIIDNMLNLELLFRTTQLTGDSLYYQIAVNHANTTLANHFRPDASSYHVVDYDPQTGTVRMKCTHQGLFDESVWSRGQAWGLYGYTMCYRFTHNPAYLAQAEKIADYFFHLPDLPKDFIPYWDMKDPAIPNSPRDASAAAVMASGLYELSTYVSGEKGRQYKATADKIISSLNQHYRAAEDSTQGFLLLHSTGNYPAKDEIDVPISYADYYYLEALLRKNQLEK